MHLACAQRSLLPVDIHSKALDLAITHETGASNQELIYSLRQIHADGMTRGSVNCLTIPEPPFAIPVTALHPPPLPPKSGPQINKETPPSHQ